MIITTEIIAKKYAVAFLNVFGKSISEESLQHIAHLEKAITATHKKFLVLLSIPILSPAVKKHVIDEIATYFKLNTAFIQLMNTLIAHKRVHLLDQIIKHIINEYQKIHHLDVFTIEVSHALQEQEKTRIINFIKNFMPQHTIKTEFKVQPKLISGMRIKSDTFLWEQSIQKRLQLVKQNMFRRVGL